MNERIKEIAQQADVYARSDNSSMLLENFQQRYTEKFAELLLEDVRQIITDVYQEVPFEQSAQFLYLEEEIVEHFYGTPRKLER
jgi:hypothetical protein